MICWDLRRWIQYCLRLDGASFNGELLFFCGGVLGCEYIELMCLTFLLPAIKDYWDLDEGGLVGGVTYFGMLCGAYIWSITIDRYGRRWTINRTMAICFIFSFASVF